MGECTWKAQLSYLLEVKHTLRLASHKNVFMVLDFKDIQVYAIVKASSSVFKCIMPKMLLVFKTKKF